MLYQVYCVQIKVDFYYGFMDLWIFLDDIFGLCSNFRNKMAIMNPNAIIISTLTTLV